MESQLTTFTALSMDITYIFILFIFNSPINSAIASEKEQYKKKVPHVIFPYLSGLDCG